MTRCYKSFQALLLRFQAVIRMLPDRPADARRTLEDAVDRASQAITEGRDAVQGLRLSTVEKNDLAVAIRTVGEELATAEKNESSPEFKVGGALRFAWHAGASQTCRR
jgi:signal transduction histidine kinase